LDRFTRCVCVHTAMANGSSLNILCLQSFSSIVGPNGSGKSNTIDALLFVFGYRASKMRQGILSELIHNSARYPDLDDCSVKFHFREIIDLVR
jgi:structural maintenance of chromosome 4